MEPDDLSEETPVTAEYVVGRKIAEIERATVDIAGTASSIETFLFTTKTSGPEYWVPLGSWGRIYSVAHRPVWNVFARAKFHVGILGEDGGFESLGPRLSGDWQKLPLGREAHLAVLAPVGGAHAARTRIQASGARAVLIVHVPRDTPQAALDVLDVADELILADSKTAREVVIGPSPGDRTLDQKRAAIRLVRHDERRRNFVAIDDGHREAEIDLESIRNGDYEPSPATLVWIPKSRTALRRGTLLSERDRLAFAAIAHEVAPLVAFDVSSYSRDLAHQLKARTDFGSLFEGEASCWRRFRRESEALLSGAEWVAFADIAGFYDNIPHYEVRRALEHAGVGAGSARSLLSCLRRWSGRRGRGIPQGFSASDLLSKIVLLPLDRALTDAGIKYVRFVDDFRLYFKDEAAAFLGLDRLQTMLNELGLDLNFEKTSVVPVADARDRIRGAASQFAFLEEAVGVRLPEQMGVYGTVSNRMVVMRPAERDSLRALFEAEFERLAQDDEPPPDLLRYLLYRLEILQSASAVEWALEKVFLRPDLTHACLSYLASQSLCFDNVELLESLSRIPRVLPYQMYRLLVWCSSYGSFESSGPVLEFCEQVMNDDVQPTWLKAFASTVSQDFRRSSPNKADEHRRDFSGG